MTKIYRKKIETVEAIKWDGSNLGEVSAFVGDCLGPIERRPDYKLKVKGRNDERWFYVEVDVGDFIYKNADGIFHVTKERWFFQQFEEV